MKRLVLLVTFLLPIFIVWGQNPVYTSIHHEQHEFYRQLGVANNPKGEADWDAINNRPTYTQPKGMAKANCTLQYDAYGWHPYWMGTAYNNYDFSLLSTFSYFNYDLDPTTGNYTTIHAWKTTPSVDLAIAAGCRVELCVTNFGSANNTTFLTNPTAQQTLIDSLISLINYRGAHGVNIDFEGVPGSMRNNLTTFMSDLSLQLRAAIPGATVTMAGYSVDWNNVFDIPALDAVSISLSLWVMV
ncbi:MAG: hypothetical protein JKY42_02995, partial [Flavobacteriales bacterium]|nr:hypothetical protein [Flavobacteriales bacterium]